MKKISVLVIVLGIVSHVNAQPGKPAKPVVKPPVKPVAPLLKNASDSLSYVLGEVAAFNLVQQGLGEIKVNGTAFLRGMTDITGKKPTLVNDIAANEMLNKFLSKEQEKKVQPNIEEGKKFLAQNKLKPGVKTTGSGLQYEVITEGTGIKPTEVDTFVVNYRGTLLNGTEFDASYKRNQPLTMPMNKVIRGWTEGLRLMAVGSKYKMYIPYELGYGSNDNGLIPGGSLLIFEIELLDVKKKQ
ncbi:MAG: FKBP-type peptidyl-prolyl cis-trans isomerase [Chitinophagaceae bacterium]